MPRLTHKTVVQGRTGQDRTVKCILLEAFFVTYDCTLTDCNDQLCEFKDFSKTLNDHLPLKHSSDRPQTLPKRVSDDPRHFIFRRRKNFFETSNGRLPPKHGSDRRETLPKRVSGDPRHFIFRRQKQMFDENF